MRRLHAGQQEGERRFALERIRIIVHLRDAALCAHTEPNLFHLIINLSLLRVFGIEPEVVDAISQRRLETQCRRLVLRRRRHCEADAVKVHLIAVDCDGEIVLARDRHGVAAVKREDYLGIVADIVIVHRSKVVEGDVELRTTGIWLDIHCCHIGVVVFILFDDIVVPIDTHEYLIRTAEEIGADRCRGIEPLTGLKTSDVELCCWPRNVIRTNHLNQYREGSGITFTGVHDSNLDFSFFSLLNTVLKYTDRLIIYGQLRSLDAGHRPATQLGL